MAIYHAHTKPISRGKGHSATANAAYIGGKEITDTRTGEVFDYSRKSGVLANEIVLPDGIEIAELTSEKLWNLAEAAENRQNSRVGREWEISLPHELSHEQRAELAKELTQKIADQYGVACEYAIHLPTREGSDERNHHVHILATTRKIDNNGRLGAKADIELENGALLKAGKPIAQEQIKVTREMIAETINLHLEKALCNERISHKTLKEQGIEREATTHKGKALTEQERKLEKEAIKFEAQINHDGSELAKANAELDKIQQKAWRLEFKPLGADSNQQSWTEIDRARLFEFARQNNEWFTLDKEKQCYKNRDSSLEVYRGRVMVHQPTEKSIRDGLKIARMQFGTCLEINGSEEFIEKAIQVLAKNQELADIRLANPEQQQRLEEAKVKSLEIAQYELNVVEKARQWLENKEPLKRDINVPHRQVEQQNSSSNLTAVERAKQLLADKHIRSTHEIAKELAQEKEQRNQQKVATQPQEKTIEKEAVQEKQLERSKDWGMSM